MKIRTVCLLIDVGVQEANNRKSYLATIQDSLLPVISKLEAGDCLMIYEASGINAYDDVGSCIAAVTRYSPHKFILPNAFKEVMEVAMSVGIDEDVVFFLITDSFKKDYAYPCLRTVKRTPNQNIYRKDVAFHFWGIGKKCEDIGFQERLPNVEIIMFNDATDVKTELIEQRIFQK